MTAGCIHNRWYKVLILEVCALQVAADRPPERIRLQLLVQEGTGEVSVSLQVPESGDGMECESDSSPLSSVVSSSSSSDAEESDVEEVDMDQVGA